MPTAGNKEQLPKTQIAGITACRTCKFHTRIISDIHANLGIYKPIKKPIRLSYPVNSTRLLLAKFTRTYQPATDIKK